MPFFFTSATEWGFYSGVGGYSLKIEIIWAFTISQFYSWERLFIAHFESQIILIVLFMVENSSSQGRVFPPPQWPQRAKKKTEPLSPAVFLEYAMSKNIKMYIIVVQVINLKGSLLQVVPRASVWARRRETADRQRQTWELSGARKPKQTRGLCSLCAHQWGEARESGPQDEGHTRDDPIPGEGTVWMRLPTG